MTMVHEKGASSLNFAREESLLRLKITLEVKKFMLDMYQKVALAAKKT